MNDCFATENELRLVCGACRQNVKSERVGPSSEKQKTTHFGAFLSRGSPRAVFPSPSPPMRRAAATLLARSLAADAGARAVASSARAGGTHVGDELFCRQRSRITLGNRVPTLSPDAWVAPNAVLVGDVDLYDQVRGGWE